MRIVISLGGSVIVPDDIDFRYLKEFKELIMDFIKKGYKFVIFCGGGQICRNYQEAAKKLGVEDEDLDWIGISVTKLNADLVRSVFNLDGFQSDPNKIELKDVVVMSGWKPGSSTDYDSVIVAKKINADMIVNITDVRYVYDKDPGKFQDAKPLKNVSWQKMRNLFGGDWKPGMHAPFDPIASRSADGLKVVVTNKDLNNLKKLFSGEDFEGTVIS